MCWLRQVFAYFTPGVFIPCTLAMDKLGPISIPLGYIRKLDKKLIAIWFNVVLLDKRNNTLIKYFRSVEG